MHSPIADRDEVFSFIDKMIEDLTHLPLPIQPEACPLRTDAFHSPHSGHLASRPDSMTSASEPYSPPASAPGVDTMQVDEPRLDDEPGDVHPRPRRERGDSRPPHRRGGRSSRSGRLKNDSNVAVLDVLTEFLRAERRAKELDMRRASYNFDQYVRTRTFDQPRRSEHSNSYRRVLDNRPRDRACVSNFQ